MNSTSENTPLLEKAHNYLNQLSSKKLRLGVNFLAYLQEKEEEEATQELLSIPDFEQELKEAEEQIAIGEVVSFNSIRRDV
ncbi:hypothetical protein VB715_17610 [Crocosphaera sp. UHCC 0190]|uniref:hypothetical protein n=1 Tax=Crocosphaera sp. UHCC 0190 TaxID=3110246 RepID=UPI002B20ABE4|nr:hypothetical protein [Crocosphaera sp. UHCC 0190]MEA5511594.1 hypothetical protein [Crocosphaera sp. UHCC 0190]